MFSLNEVAETSAKIFSSKSSASTKKNNLLQLALVAVMEKLKTGGNNNFANLFHLTNV